MIFPYCWFLKIRPSCWDPLFIKHGWESHQNHVIYIHLQHLQMILFHVFHDFPWFSIMFHVFPCFSMIFPTFSMIFHDFSIIFHDFPMIFQWFSLHSSRISLPPSRRPEPGWGHDFLHVASAIAFLNVRRRWISWRPSRLCRYSWQKPEKCEYLVGIYGDI